jgi:glycosyltransferase involved in cell wall biosynthesis
VNGPDNAATADVLKVAAGHKVVRIQQAGIARALNAGIGVARGEWLAFLDDDDLWEPHRLEAALRTANATQASLIFCDFVAFGENGGFRAPPMRPPKNLSTREALTIQSYSGCSSAFARRSAVLAVGGFDDELAGPDWDLWMRLAWRYPVAWTDDYLVWIRRHPRNTSHHLSWVKTSLAIQRKALRTLPKDLRHMRARVIFEMVRVMVKGTESYIRRRLLRRGKPAMPTAAAGLRPPLGP